VPVPVHVADVSRRTVAGQTSLGGLSHAGPMIVTKEDRRRRRRRQLRALKATLKIPGQERLYRVSLRRAWKTERERLALVISRLHPPDLIASRSRSSLVSFAFPFSPPLATFIRPFISPSSILGFLFLCLLLSLLRRSPMIEFFFLRSARGRADGFGDECESLRGAKRSMAD